MPDTNFQETLSSIKLNIEEKRDLDSSSISKPIHSSGASFGRNMLKIAVVRVIEASPFEFEHQLRKSLNASSNPVRNIYFRDCRLRGAVEFALTLLFCAKVAGW